MKKTFNIKHFNCIDSTNNYLKENYTTLPNYSVIIADEQTNGRGQFDHQFHSNKNSGLYMSILLKDIPKNSNSNLITFYSALCCLKAIERLYHCTINIKWINDLYYQQKKLGGILVENIYQGQNLQACIIGIGINLTNTNYPLDIKNKVINLTQITHKSINRDQLLVNILNYFEQLQSYNQTTLINEYKKYCLSLNQTYTYKQKTYQAIDININGELVLQNNNETITLNSSYLLNKSS